MKRLLLLAILVTLPGCGDDKSSSPSSPSTTPPPPVNVQGLWTGGSTTTGANGGECLAQTFASLVGSTSNYTVQITQSGSSLTAVVTDTKTGIYTNYSGTAGGSSISLAWTYSSAGSISGIRCPNGQLRDMKLNTSTITADIVGNRGTGTAGETWNIYVAGTQTSVGVFNGTSSFTMTR